MALQRCLLTFGLFYRTPHTGLLVLAFDWITSNTRWPSIILTAFLLNQ